MTDKMAIQRSSELHRAIDEAILQQTKLQEARRELYYFLRNNPSQAIEAASESPEFTELTLCLRSALADSQLAIQNLNVELGL